MHFNAPRRSGSALLEVHLLSCNVQPCSGWARQNAEKCLVALPQVRWARLLGSGLSSGDVCFAQIKCPPEPCLRAAIGSNCMASTDLNQVKQQLFIARLDSQHEKWWHAGNVCQTDANVTNVTRVLPKNMASPKPHKLREFCPEMW